MTSENQTESSASLGWRQRLKESFQAFSAREDRLFLLLAVLIGIFAGLSVVCFRMAIEWSRLWLLGSAEAPSTTRLLIVPGVVGLFVGIIVKRFFPRVRGSGVNQTKTAVYVSDGYIPFHTVIGKFLLCALVIGGGHSLGPEDPSLQIGAGIASMGKSRVSPGASSTASLGASVDVAALSNLIWAEPRNPLAASVLVTRTKIFSPARSTAAERLCEFAPLSCAGVCAAAERETKQTKKNETIGKHRQFRLSRPFSFVPYSLFISTLAKSSGNPVGPSQLH